MIKFSCVLLIASLSSPCLAQDKCTTVSDCAQKAMEAAYQAKLALQLAVPKGAVMAFNLEKCPEGWSTFAPLYGRVIVGAGSGAGLKERKLGDKGGEEDHRLTVEEMPKHTHKSISSDGNHSPTSGDYSPTEFGYKNITEDTTASGGDQPHNIMQPYTVLQYCERK